MQVKMARGASPLRVTSGKKRDCLLQTYHNILFGFPILVNFHKKKNRMIIPCETFKCIMIVIVG